jgi:hypothetical protein
MRHLKDCLDKYATEIPDSAVVGYAVIQGLIDKTDPTKDFNFVFPVVSEVKLGTADEVALASTAICKSSTTLVKQPAGGFTFWWCRKPYVARVARRDAYMDATGLLISTYSRDFRCDVALDLAAMPEAVKLTVCVP